MHENLYYFSAYGDPSLFQGELVGLSYCDGTYYQARKNSDVTVIEYILSGSGTVQVDGVKHTARAGDVYLLPLYTNHLYYSDSRDPWVKYFMNIRGSLPPELIKSYQLELQYIFHNSDTEELFAQLYKTAQLGTDAIDPERQQELFASLFHRILIRLHHTRHTVERPSDTATIKSVIDNSPNRIYTIDELAQLVNRSKDYIIKAFQQSYGITPHSYIIEHKMQSARLLLSSTDSSIEEIALQLGYKNPEHFSTLFKRKCGVTPRNYRISQRIPTERK